VLSDINAKLVAMYQSVRDDVDNVIRHLEDHKNEKEHFLKVRRDNMLVGSKARRGADFIYLNRCCFNGVYRENKKGEFNVPFGDNPKAKYCDEGRLRVASRQLKCAVVREADFEVVLQTARKGDLAYLDSPYAPLSPTSNFTAYDKSGFTVDDHRRLRTVFQQLVSRGVHVILSASSALLTFDLYAGKKDCRLFDVDAKRSVNSKSDKRGAVKEVLVVSPELVKP
jgi:DNA adenine methylase